MNQGRPPFTLDDILNRTRHLLLSFNGPVCPLFTDTTSAAIAARLRDLLTEQGIALPAEIEQTADWQQVLTYAASVSPQLAESVEAELTKLESTSAETATPTPHLHEIVTACRESGRSLAIISGTSATVVRSYLADYSLDNAITVVIARTSTALATPTQSQIEQAARELDALPSACAVLTAIPIDIDAARYVGALSIGYAKTSDVRDDLANAGADSIVHNLADLALRLRVRRPGV